MRNRIAILILGVLLFCGGLSRADIVQLDLSTLGMPAGFNMNSPYWQTNFDLGVTFTEISHVYIDWSGGITGGLAVYYPGQQPFPLDVGVYAGLGFNPDLRITEVWGGAASYPSPQIFQQQNEFTLSGTTTWSDLLDGKAKITLGYTEFVFGLSGGGYTQHGSIALNSATLVVDGTVTPEPASILLLAMGAFALRAKYLNKL